MRWKRQGKKNGPKRQEKKFHFDVGGTGKRLFGLEQGNYMVNIL